MFMKRILIYVVILFLASNIFGQNGNKADASFYRDSIIIGQHTELIVNVSFEKGEQVLMFQGEDTIIDGIEILHRFEPQHAEGIFTEKFIITSFDTGYYYIPSIVMRKVKESDTFNLQTNSLELFVIPYIIIDTIPVDTIYSGVNGFIVTGKDGFRKDIDKMIPDSVKRQISADSLQIVKEGVKQQFLQMFASQIMNNTGLTDRDEIFLIAEANEQSMFIVNRTGILEKHIVAGSVDTVFVQEFQQVNQGDALFTLYKIKDIDENLFNTPFNLSELIYYILDFLKKYWWLVLILVIIIFAIVYYFVFYIKGKVPTFLKIKSPEPAHIIALRKLELIKKEKIWQKGEYKEFYVQLTNVVREYIDKRFGVFAMEMTSSEIIENTTEVLESDDLLGKLTQILTLADAVKFAKAQPLQNENDLSIKNAFEFVDQTKEIEEVEKTHKLDAEIEIVEDSENEINNPEKEIKDE